MGLLKWWRDRQARQEAEHNRRIAALMAPMYVFRQHNDLGPTYARKVWFQSVSGDRGIHVHVVETPSAEYAERFTEAEGKRILKRLRRLDDRWKMIPVEML